MAYIETYLTQSPCLCLEGQGAVLNSQPEQPGLGNTSKRLGKRRVHALGQGVQHVILVAEVTFLTGSLWLSLPTGTRPHHGSDA